MPAPVRSRSSFTVAAVMAMSISFFLQTLPVSGAAIITDG
jgi:hypothetical protein